MWSNSTTGQVMPGSPRWLSRLTPRPCELEARLPLVPAEIRAGRHQADLLDEVLADVGDEHLAGLRVPREALRIADAERVDLAERVALAVTNGFDAGMPYLPFALFVPSGSMRRILPNAELMFCAGVVGIAAAAAVGEADVEQAEVGAPGRRERIERDLPAVVIGNGCAARNSSRGAAPSYVAAAGSFAVHSSSTRVVRATGARPRRSRPSGRHVRSVSM